MNSTPYDGYTANNGNDGNKSSIFVSYRNTNEKSTYWGVDFGLDDQLVTRVNLTTEYWGKS